MNQTNNRIREEIQKDLDDGKFYSICSNETTFKNYIFELLKSQREEMIDKIEKMIKIVNYQRGGFFIEEESYNEAIKDILYLIKNN